MALHRVVSCLIITKLYSLCYQNMWKLFCLTLFWIQYNRMLIDQVHFCFALTVTISVAEEFYVAIIFLRNGMVESIQNILYWLTTLTVDKEDTNIHVYNGGKDVANYATCNSVVHVWGQHSFCLPGGSWGPNKNYLPTQLHTSGS